MDAAFLTLGDGLAAEEIEPAQQLRLSVARDQVAFLVDLADTTSPQEGPARLGFNPALNYAAQTLGWALRQGAANIAWFVGADPTGSTDMTAIMAMARTLSSAVYLPAGTWAMNYVATSSFVLLGAGGDKTIVKPFDIDEAAFTYRAAAPYWAFASLVERLRFQGSSRTGVGFTFGRTNPADFVAGDQYANNVTFRNVNFWDLHKGFQAPFGNIGCCFYACGFNGCYYGAYCLDNKFGGDNMHAGNKYFHGCHFGANLVGLYVHNVTDGFGGLVLDSTIMEGNAFNAWIYTNNTFGPVSFNGGWNEASGTNVPAGVHASATLAVDSWAGATRTSPAVDLATFYFDGDNAQYDFSRFGGVHGLRLKATNSSVDVTNSRSEDQPGFSGAPCVVDDASSVIRLHHGCATDGGVIRGSRVICENAPRMKRYTIDAGNGFTRWFVVSPRIASQGSFNGAGVSLKGNIPTAMLGSVSSTPSVVADGVAFSLCTEHSIPFTAVGQGVSLGTSSFALSAGWCAVTFEVKSVSGPLPEFYVWDQSNAQLITAARLSESGVWQTIAGVGYSPGGQTVFLDVRSTANGTVVARLGHYQIKQFATQHEAQAYLNSRVFAVPVFAGSATFDPTSLADGDGQTTTVAVAGAALGDMAEASFTADLQGLTVSAWVSAADTVSVRLQNESGATVDLASGTLYVKAARP